VAKHAKTRARRSAPRPRARHALPAPARSYALPSLPSAAKTGTVAGLILSASIGGSVALAATQDAHSSSLATIRVAKVAPVAKPRTAPRRVHAIEAMDVTARAVLDRHRMSSVRSTPELLRSQSPQLRKLDREIHALLQAELILRRMQHNEAAAARLILYRHRLQALVSEQRRLVDSLHAVDLAPASEQAAVTVAAPVASTGQANAPAAGSAVGIVTAALEEAPSQAARTAIQVAYDQIGKPYVYGAAGPYAYDCSGLTMYAFGAAGIALPHDAQAQYAYGTHVSLSDLMPGDLVFFGGGGYIGHVGIYLGRGLMIDAPHTGTTVGIHALYPDLVGATRLS
jgi:cell wall-associated NlpC family hydrolase